MSSLPVVGSRSGYGMINPLQAAMISAPAPVTERLRKRDNTGGLMEALVDYFVEMRFLGTAVLVVCLSYAVVSSMALSVFDCLPDSIGGSVYLKRDLRVKCNVGSHVALQLGAGAMLLILGAGLPIGVGIMLSRTKASTLRHDDAFFELYGFLYRGYDIGRGLQAWESLVMIKKVAIVAIGSLFTEPYNAVQLSISVSVVALLLHALYYPF